MLILMRPPVLTLADTRPALPSFAVNAWPRDKTCQATTSPKGPKGNPPDIGVDIQAHYGAERRRPRPCRHRRAPQMHEG